MKCACQIAIKYHKNQKVNKFRILWTTNYQLLNCWTIQTMNTCVCMHCMRTLYGMRYAVYVSNQLNENLMTKLKCLVTYCTMWIVHMHIFRSNRNICCSTIFFFFEFIKIPWNVNGQSIDNETISCKWLRKT